MARATAEWQDEVGAMKLDAASIGDDAGALADAILERFAGSEQKKRA